MQNINFLNAMLRIRMTEEKIAEKYHEGKMRCPTHLSIGQEAISVGVCSNFSNNDLDLMIANLFGDSVKGNKYLNYSINLTYIYLISSIV